MTAATFGTYRLDGELGRGGMGIVHRAFDLDLERFVALKVLPVGLSADEEFRERFRREARAAARLTAPEVVPIHRFGEVDGQLFLDMRLVEGRDLAVLLRSEGPLAPERAVTLITRVAAALDAAKAQGLLHRDVKPANILVEAGVPELAYLGDFGIARSIEATDRSVLTNTGAAIGTLDYMAPERFTTGQVDHGVDVYALACVLFECLAGHKPFQGDGALAMMHAHCYTDPPLLDGPLGPVIARGMAKDPAARTASAGEFAAQARAALRPAPETSVIDRPTSVVEHETAIARAPITFAPLPADPAQAGPGQTDPRHAGPQQPGPQDSGPQRTVPQPSGPEDPGSQQPGPRDSGSHHVGPRGTAPQHTGPDQVLTGPQPVVPRPRSAARWAIPVAVFLAVAAVGTVLFGPNGNSVAGSPVAAGGAVVPAAGECDRSRGTLTVGVIIPLTGDLSALAVGIKNSAQLAVEQANERCAVPGYALALDPQDDESKVESGARAATRFAADPDVVGVVGTFSSSVARGTIPVLAKASIAQVSPSNTNTALTRGEGPIPNRLTDNYFRVCTTDDLQGPFAAQYLAAEGKRRVAVVTDGGAYGAMLADGFQRRAAAEGVTVIAQESLTSQQTDFTTLAGKLAAARPDAVYFGGEYPQAGPLARQLTAAGLTVPLIGGDGIYADQFITLAARDGDLATVVSATPEDLPSAREFVQAYAKRGYREPIGPYGALAYDATNVIIDSVATVVDSNGSWRPDLRPKLLTTIGDHSAPGATGPVSFDEYGDTTNTTLTVNEVSGGKWTSAFTGQVKR